MRAAQSRAAARAAAAAPVIRGAAAAQFFESDGWSQALDTPPAPTPAAATAAALQAGVPPDPWAAGIALRQKA